LVNYHDYAERFLTLCRDSLRGQSYPADFFQVYIVDNDSSEKTSEYLVREYPEAIILPRSNGNYAAANNFGAKEAIKDGCEYVVSANMDTEMDVDWLKELVVALDENQAAGIAQSKILLYPENDKERQEPRINSLGNIIHFLGFGFTGHYGEKDCELSDYPEIKGYASGCSFIFRADVFKKIGGWNEEFYMYHDDIEFSLKTRLAGYKVILAPKSRIFHKYEFSRSIRMFYYMERNRYLTLFIFAPARYLLLVSPLLFAMSFGMLLLMVVNGTFKQAMKITFYFLKPSTWIRIWFERMKIKDFSRIKFNDVAADFSGRIEFQEISNPILKYIANPIMSVYFRVIKKFI